MGLCILRVCFDRQFIQFPRLLLIIFSTLHKLQVLPEINLERRILECKLKSSRTQTIAGGYPLLIAFS